MLNFVILTINIHNKLLMVGQILMVGEILKRAEYGWALYRNQLKINKYKTAHQWWLIEIVLKRAKSVNAIHLKKGSRPNANPATVRCVSN